jgi:hypothetical protein
MGAPNLPKRCSEARLDSRMTLAMLRVIFPSTRLSVARVIAGRKSSYASTPKAPFSTSLSICPTAACAQVAQVLRCPCQDGEPRDLHLHHSLHLPDEREKLVAAGASVLTDHPTVTPTETGRRDAPLPQWTSTMPEGCGLANALRTTPRDTPNVTTNSRVGGSSPPGPSFQLSTHPASHRITSSTKLGFPRASCLG